MTSSRAQHSGFTLVEIMIATLLMGMLMLAFMGIFISFQRSTSQTHHYTDAQQNARIAIDYVTDFLRQAGTGTDYVRGQRAIVHAAPYQVAFNADIDNGKTVGGAQALASIERDYSPNTVPPSGTTLYSPPRDYDSPAETIVLTIDSNNDGVITSGDGSDDTGEGGANPHLFVLKKFTYGFDGSGTNEVRSADLALIRGPAPRPNGTYPPPLFQYYYDDDADISTPNKLWGDDSPEDGTLDDTEKTALTPVPDSLLARVQRIKVTVISESEDPDPKYEDNGGFLAVSMNSEVFIRNYSRSNSIIFGHVFHDIDGDGVLGENETGIPDVEIRLMGVDRTMFTNGAGTYAFPVDPGSHTVREFDPAGYSSTTPNVMTVSVVSGEAVTVNFGDKSGAAVGVINGSVYEDLDLNGLRTVGEPGLAQVSISLDTGEQMTTDAGGNYEFMVPVGNYTVVETDPTGYSSTTPNARTADVLVGGDTVTVDFGDSQAPVYGTIEGYVFEDANQDGVRSMSDDGIANVTLRLSTGDSTVTNAAGFYQFSVSPGVYSITERDPPGYTSSTVNTYIGILIVADTTVTRHFGDFLSNQNDFIEIVINDTERALTVDAFDMKEDNKSDADLVVGTPFSASGGNILVFHNKRKNQGTPLSQLFNNTPNYTRDAAYDVNTMCNYDFSGDGTGDVLTGLNANTASNLQIWHMESAGILAASPAESYASDQSTYVLDSKLADINNDGNIDIIVGLRDFFGNLTGAVQVFENQSGLFNSTNFITTAGSDIVLGEVRSLDAGDVDGDGDMDIVVGSKSSEYIGHIDIYLNEDYASGRFYWGSRYLATGAVNDLRVIDMMEDDAGDPDIVAGLSTAPNDGRVALWLNHEGQFGIEDETDYSFGPEETENWPHDVYAPSAEVLSIDAARVNPDVFPDVLVGTRSSSVYGGDLFYLETFGMLPSSGIQLNNVSIGEVWTMKVADFNKDNWLDVVVGTRTSATDGRILIYFYEE